MNKVTFNLASAVFAIAAFSGEPVVPAEDIFEKLDRQRLPIRRNRGSEHHHQQQS
jgi:hypothetical protein